MDHVLGSKVSQQSRSCDMSMLWQTLCLIPPNCIAEHLPDPSNIRPDGSKKEGHSSILVCALASDLHVVICSSTGITRCYLSFYCLAVLSSGTLTKSIHAAVSEKHLRGCVIQQASVSCAAFLDAIERMMVHLQSAKGSCVDLSSCWMQGSFRAASSV